MKRSIMILLVAGLLLAVPPASAQTLDELARIVREAATSEAQIDQEREARFIRERDKQKELLAEARKELTKENIRSDNLRVEYDQNERALAELVWFGRHQVMSRRLWTIPWCPRKCRAAPAFFLHWRSAVNFRLCRN